MQKFIEFMINRDLLEMDATRERRQRDPIRQKWYARQRQIRFANLGLQDKKEDKNKDSK